MSKPPEVMGRQHKSTLGSRKRVIGLIGGIGSGKSQVAMLLAQYGARVISGDEAGHEALRQPEIIAEVVNRWGRQVLDVTGAVDRRKVARIVFADPAELRALEALVFPWIGQHLREQIAAAMTDSSVPFIVLDAAVMLEVGWNDVCDVLVYVDVPAELRSRRLVEGRGWNAKEVTARESMQMPLCEKKQRADYVLDNSDSLTHLARQVDEMLKRWDLAS